MATVNIEDIANTLSNLPVLELAKLKTLLEEKWGVKAQAAMPQMAAAPQAGKAQEAQEESTEFQVTLEEAPADKKIGVIKVNKKDATEVIRSGNGQNYAVLTNTDNGFYEIGFMQSPDKESLSSVEKEILSTFEFD